MSLVPHFSPSGESTCVPNSVGAPGTYQYGFGKPRTHINSRAMHCQRKGWGGGGGDVGVCVSYLAK